MAWAQQIYGVHHLPTFDDVEAMFRTDPVAAALRYVPLKRGYVKRFLDLLLYGRRMEIVAETLLLDANERAEAATAASRSSKPNCLPTKAVCHVVGLGYVLFPFFNIYSRPALPVTR